MFDVDAAHAESAELGADRLGRQVAQTPRVLHRDVKPGNVLFDTAGTPKVTDFGIAKIVEASAATASVAGLGTPAYVAPEQIQRGRLGPATDLYALGVVLYQLLTGALPFDPAGGMQALFHDHLNTTPAPPAGVPAPVADVVLRALAKDPADRHPSAHAFALDLARAAATAYGPGWAARSGLVLRLDNDVSAAVQPPPPGGTADGHQLAADGKGASAPTEPATKPLTDPRPGEVNGPAATDPGPGEVNGPAATSPGLLRRGSGWRTRTRAGRSPRDPRWRTGAGFAGGRTRIVRPARRRRTRPDQDVEPVKVTPPHLSRLPWLDPRRALATVTSFLTAGPRHVRAVAVLEVLDLTLPRAADAETATAALDDSWSRLEHDLDVLLLRIGPPPPEGTVRINKPRGGQ